MISSNARSAGTLLWVMLGALIFCSCEEETDTKTTFTVANNLNMDRQRETISIPTAEVSQLVEKYGAENLLLKEEGSTEILVTQVVDSDADGTADEILFQTDIAAKAEKRFTLEGTGGEVEQRESALTTFSRFVPERIDDYAWENDQVAFRTYGPEAQRRTEAGEKGGTLTSGIDCWLKRVDYPIINKWYQAHQEKPGAYHIDSGEGYDPYHVGDSRGCGGIGVWENDSLYVSKNFVAWKRIATGPIRTIFELSYAPWKANGRRITETKRISLDLGSNLSRYEIALKSDEPLPNCAIGITLHEQEGEVKVNEEKGWYRYWEPIDGSELGLGIVIDPEQVQSFKDHRVEAPDQSHLLVLADVEKQSVVYYAGFGWKKSGQFASAAGWDQYLDSFASRLSSPLHANF
jgi:hypothetical protein